jgi:DNA polymerase III subunit epsilon
VLIRREGAGGGATGRANRRPSLVKVATLLDKMIASKPSAPFGNSHAMSEFVALDLETTGLSPENDRIVEVAAVRFDSSGRDLGEFHALVNPDRPVSARAREIHGISDADLAAAPFAGVVLARFLAWLDEAAGATLLAHNASFDAAFLGAELARNGIARNDLAIVDTLPLGRKLASDSPNHRLDTLARRFGLDPSNAHRALADSLRVKGLWLGLTGGVMPADPVAYRVVAPSGGPPVPSGWEMLSEAMAAGRRLRIAYDGGSRGLAPREITPRRFRHLGGVAYVVAECHAASAERTFRLDRVVRWEVVS